MTQTLFHAGPWSTAAAEYQANVRADVAALLREHQEQAERDNLFPKPVLVELAKRGHFRARWEGGRYGDLGRSVVFFYELGRQLAGGIGLGLTLHLEAVLSIVRNAKPRPGGRDLHQAMLEGEEIGCIGITEPESSAELRFLTCRAERVDGGWKLTGRKKFISLTKNATFCMLLAKTGERPNDFTFFIVPRAGYRIVETLGKLGTRALETTLLDFEGTVVPEDHVVGGVGRGLLYVMPSMTHERLAGSAGLLGTVETCANLASAYLKRRKTPEGSRWDHQVLRHRLADVLAEHQLLWQACRFIAWSLEQGEGTFAEVAALKLKVANGAERMVSECLQLFGGAGYLDEWPLERALRDVRVGRIGGGTDEVLREAIIGLPLPEEPLQNWLDHRQVE